MSLISCTKHSPTDIILCSQRYNFIEYCRWVVIWLDIKDNSTQAWWYALLSTHVDVLMLLLPISQSQNFPWSIFDYTLPCIVQLGQRFKVGDWVLTILMSDGQGEWTEVGKPGLSTQTRPWLDTFLCAFPSLSQPAPISPWLESSSYCMGGIHSTHQISKTAEITVLSFELYSMIHCKMPQSQHLKFAWA